MYKISLSLVCLCMLMTNLYAHETSGEASPRLESSFNPFIISLHLDPVDSGRQSLMVTPHFPQEPENQLLGVADGWQIYPANDLTMPDRPQTDDYHLYDLRLLMIPQADAKSEITLDLESLYTGRRSLFEFFRPRTRTRLQIPVQITDEGITVDSDSGQLESSFYPGFASIPDNLNIMLPPISSFSPPGQQKQLKRKVEQSPARRSIQVLMVNDRDDVESGRGWLSLTTARLSPDYIDVEMKTMPRSAAPSSWRTLNHCRLKMSAYRAHFVDQLRDGTPVTHDCTLSPITHISTLQNPLQGMFMYEDTLTLIIDHMQQTNFYHDDGRFKSRRQHVKRSSYIQIQFRNGHVRRISGNYQQHIKRILVNHARGDRPASLILIANSNMDMDLYSQTGLPPYTEIIELDRPDAQLPLGEGYEQADAGSHPLWMMDWGSQMATQETMEIPQLVYSPI